MKLQNNFNLNSFIFKTNFANSGSGNGFTG